MNYMLMPFRRYADFNGRSRRSEYWLFLLFQVIVATIAMILIAVAGGAMIFSGGDPGQLVATGGIFMIFLVLFVVYCLASIIPLYAVSVRRLHDTGRSGWWVFGPALLSIFTQILAVAAGTTGDLGLLMLLSGGLTMVGLVLNLVVLVFLCLDGTPGPNQFGHDPKHRGYEHTFA